jgi:hypothetical protein
MLTPPVAPAVLVLLSGDPFCTDSSTVDALVLGCELLSGDWVELLRAGVGIVGESMRS